MASGKGGSGSGLTETIKERKLRPLYDMLDLGNNKKVIQEADKLLKKHPEFSTAKVFKAIASMRLAKMEECLALLKEVYDEVPTDEPTLHAMSIAYRELDMPEKVCEMLENACKKENKNEELYSALFMAYVRMFDFASQHKVATQLYKLTNKSIYLYWAAMSLYAKGTKRDDSKIGQSITLPLASKMIAKLINERTNASERDLYFQLIVMMEMKDYKGCLEVMDEAAKSGKFPQYSKLQLGNFKVKCLEKLPDNDDKNLQSIMEDVISNDFKTFSSKAFTFYMDYIRAFALKRPEQVAEFLTKIASGRDEDAARVSRITLIAMSQMCNEKGINLPVVDPRQHFMEYYKNYGARPYFTRDLRFIFPELMKIHGMSDVIDEMENRSGKSPNTRVLTQWKTNIEVARYFTRVKNTCSTPDAVIEFVEKIAAVYKAEDTTYKDEGLKMDERHCGPYEELLVICSNALLNTYWKHTGFWDNYSLPKKLESLEIKESGDGKSHEENGPNGKTGLWFNGEFPILLHLSVLEYGLSCSPFSSVLRTLIGKVYMFVGASSAGMANIMSMDIKHSMIDSMGYLYFPKLLIGGNITEIRRAVYHADNFYNGSVRESGDGIVNSYRYGTWLQLIDFMNFRESLDSSVQRNTVRIERRLIEYTTEAHSRDVIHRFACRNDMDLKKMLAIAFDDTRDFGVIWFMKESTLSPEIEERSFQSSIEKLKLRSAIEACLTRLIRVDMYYDNESMRTENLEKALEAYEIFNSCMQGTYEEHMPKEEELDKFAIWPSSIYDYVNSGMICRLLEMGHIVKTVASSRDAFTPAELDSIGELISKCATATFDKVDFYTSRWATVDLSLINMTNLFEEVYVVVETLGFICILVQVLKSLLDKKTSTNSEAGTSTEPGKGKKKKAAAKPAANVNCEPLLAAPLKSFIRLLVSCMDKVNAVIKSVGDRCASRFAPGSFETQEPYWKEKICSEDVLTIIRQCLPSVLDKLKSDYCRICADMSDVLDKKKQMVSSLFSD